MSQTETEHKDEGKSDSGKDDFVDNPVLESQSDAHSSSCPDLTVPCSGVLPEDMQAVKKDIVNEKINEKEQSISELDEVNEENENKQKIISDLEEKLNKVNEENEKKQKRISELEEVVIKINANHKKRLSELEEKLKKAERNTRELNLWLYGLQEKKGENLKARVIDICRSVAPEAVRVFTDHIDIVHRFGQKSEGKNRPVIMSFTERSTKELLLTASYNSEYHRSSPLRFKDVLTAGDIDTRNRLWPRIKAARKEGKTAFFIGAKAIIDGKEISE